MVFLNVKATEDQQYLVDLPVTSTVHEAIAYCLQVEQGIRQLFFLKSALSPLIESKAQPEAAEPAAADSDGLAKQLQHLSLTDLPEAVRTQLRKAAADASATVHKDQVAKKVCLSPDQLHGVLDTFVENIERALQPYLSHSTTSAARLRQLVCQAGEAVAGPDGEPEMDMWFAGKLLPRKGKLSDRLGRNDKQKVVVRLQSSGQGPPAREAVLDAATQQAMLSYYSKRQETEQLLAEDDMDYASPWADSKGLKRSFNGLGAVRLR